VKISTGKGQSIFVDPTANSTTITNADGVLTVKEGKISAVSPVVEIGTGSLQPMVVGDDWKKIMGELLDELGKIIVPTPVGPSGVPTNAAKFAAIKGKLGTALSAKHRVEK
jgi:hypothetical protein